MSAKKTKRKSKKSSSKLKKFGKITMYVVLGCFAFSIIISFLYKFINPPITILMVQRSIEQSFSPEREVRLSKNWVDIEDISPNMIRAVVASEDNLFLKHDGFDFTAIEKAKKDNEKGKKLRGASTITQQTTKNVFLWPSRSYIRKGLEAYYTILIENFWSKERIMEVYLNVIEFGDGIYGVEKASQVYFGKSAKNLTKKEAALLAAILPSPLTRNPSKPTSYLNRRANAIMRIMDLNGKIEL